MTAPRPPLARLAGETPPMLGHNNGPPLDPGRSGRVHAWRVARRALAPRLPLEVVRRRVARARELGLAYPAYASILLGSGRDVIAFLFTDDALLLRLRAGRPLPEDRATRLRALMRCDRLLLADADPDDAVARIEAAHAIRFRAAAVAPEAQTAGRAALRALLDPLKLPGDAVVMVGAQPRQRDWAEAARLARFIAADAYFAPG